MNIFRMCRYKKQQQTKKQQQQTKKIKTKTKQNNNNKKKIEANKRRIFNMIAGEAKILLHLSMLTVLNVFI